MADEGLLPPKDNGGWRSAFGDPEPKPKPDERVMLTSHIHRGLGFPPSLFFLEVWGGMAGIGTERGGSS